VLEAASQLGSRATGLACDTTDPDQIAALFEQIEARIGVVSMLVNSAGIAPASNFLETSVEEFRKVIDVNVTGAFLVLQRAARAMIAQDIEGAIVNISSVAALVASPHMAAYCVSKGGVMQLTKAASLALAPYNIRVNAVGPGSIATEMLAGVYSDQESMKTITSRTPLGRLGTPEEIAEVATFLLSGKAGYITGETIYADGGRLAMNLTC